MMTKTTSFWTQTTWDQIQTVTYQLCNLLDVFKNVALGVRGRTRIVIFMSPKNYDII